MQCDIVPLVYFSFVFFAWGDKSKKIILLKQMLKNPLPMFSSKSFMVSSLIFVFNPFLTYFCAYERVVQFDSFAYSCSVFPKQLNEGAIYPLYILTPFPESNCQCKCGFISEFSILFNWSTCFLLHQHHIFLFMQLCSIFWSREMWYV